MSVHTSHRVSLVTRTAHAGYVLDGSREDTPTGNTPNGTYMNMRIIKGLDVGVLHAIGTLCKRIDHELLVLRFPPSVPLVLVDNRLDVLLDVLHLSSLVV
jgi:hypothetical protein